MLLLALIAGPAALGVITLMLRRLRLSLAVLILTAALHLGATVLLWLGVVQAGSLGSLLGLDRPGLVFLSLTSVLFFAASLYTIPYVLHSTHDPRARPERFVPTLLFFVTAMTLVVASQHLALMWAAIEATTLASAPLIYFYKRQEALEAAWKYLLICSLGIALALLGTFFLGMAASAGPGPGPGLVLGSLLGAAPHMARPWLIAAFVLALVGYGTKMGLVPMHTWLPDAHSQAPSPVSALLSGSLLNCALLGVLRFYQVVLASGNAAFARTLLVLLGLASMAVAAALMVRQRDYKRLFAYSSVENMGVITAGIGLGGTATYGALLHAVNHSFAKAALFLLAGNVLHHFGTTDAGAVRGVLRRLPWTGVLLTAGFLAVGGTPPFGPFMSELMIFQSALGRSTPTVGVLFVAILAVGFLAMAATLLPMLQGGDAGSGRGSKDGGDSVLMVGAPLALCIAVLVLGIYVPSFLADALKAAAALLGG